MDAGTYWVFLVPPKAGKVPSSGARERADHLGVRLGRTRISGRRPERTRHTSGGQARQKTWRAGPPKRRRTSGIGVYPPKIVGGLRFDEGVPYILVRNLFNSLADEPHSPPELGEEPEMLVPETLLQQVMV